MYHFVINPASRSGKGLRLWQNKIEPLLKEKNIPYEPHFSSKAGDISTIVADLVRNEIAPPVNIVILGGDGTLNEALQQVEDFSNLVLGYIPTGSSNDFARDIQIPSDPVAALDVILKSGRPQPMDIGEVAFPDGEKRRFAVSCGIGFDAAVCEEVQRSGSKGFLNKIGLGKLVYLNIALRNLMGAKHCSAELTLDGGDPIPFGDILFMATMIHRYEGGGFMFCPDAVDADGILNLCTVGDLTKSVVIRALPAAYKGKHFKYKGITPYSASTVTINTSEPLWVHTDGEVVKESNSISISCLRQVLYMIKP